MVNKKKLNDVTILFAGNSGDGIQFIGNQFANTSAYLGHNLSTFPDFPAEIRAPHDTIIGISGFQIHFGNIEINTPGDLYDVLVVMNAAALKKYLSKLKNNGIIIADISGFDTKKLFLAGYTQENNPLKILSNYKIYEIDFLKQTHQILKNSSLSIKNKNIVKNMFVLGFIYWIYNQTLDYTEKFLSKKFQNSKDLLKANIKALRFGYNFGDTSEIFTERFSIKSNKIDPNIYRNITGNEAIALGLIAISKKAELNLFYASYPITPASNILNYLSKYKFFGVKTFQAEDEIAGVSSAIGASYAGNLGVTSTSGPGMNLKQEGINLALILEIPLVIINIQRGGPSTGLPTKTEQSDLMQAFYGRNGESPIPILASRSPAHCFHMAFMAGKIAIEHMTPVILLSEGYLANGSEPWKFPTEKELSSIMVPKPYEKLKKPYYPYQRNTNSVRPWVIPGMIGYEHRIGSLEKEHITGNISYEPENHQLMVLLRQKKINEITKFLPKQNLDSGFDKGKLLLLSWGGTYGVIHTAIKKLLSENYLVSHLHIEYLYPMPLGINQIISKFEKVLIPELNNGQFIHIIRDQFLINAIPLNKIQGVPFSVDEIIKKVKQII